jgi:chloramphenicol-sensitive protein RarD
LTQQPGAERQQSGLAHGLGAYALWGLLPIYFKLMPQVGPLEMVASRVVWSLVLMALILAATGALGEFGRNLRDRRIMLAMTASALLIGVNWLTYIWAVSGGHILAASLGYFLNPLINVLLGVTFLGERLRRGQIVALCIALAGVSILAFAAIDTLWISLALGLSFGLYGLVRKVTPVAPMRGLAAETTVLAPLALGYLAWIAATGQMAFGTDPGLTALLVLAGAITAAPLLLFAMAAQQLPLTVLGVIQYIAASLQFLTGILLFGEELNRGQLFSFLLIWAGLILFTVDSVRAVRAARR